MFHFMDHLNGGKTQGSIIIAPEGMYIISRHSDKKSKLKIDETQFYKDVSKCMEDIQDEAINNYGPKISQKDSNLSQLSILLIWTSLNSILLLTLE